MFHPTGNFRCFSVFRFSSVLINNGITFRKMSDMTNILTNNNSEAAQKSLKSLNNNTHFWKLCIGIGVFCHIGLITNKISGEIVKEFPICWLEADSHGGYMRFGNKLSNRGLNYNGYTLPINEELLQACLETLAAHCTENGKIKCIIDCHFSNFPFFKVFLCPHQTFLPRPFLWPSRSCECLG